MILGTAWASDLRGGFIDDLVIVVTGDALDEPGRYLEAAIGQYRIGIGHLHRRQACAAQCQCQAVWQATRGKAKAFQVVDRMIKPHGLQYTNGHQVARTRDAGGGHFAIFKRR